MLNGLAFVGEEVGDVLLSSIPRSPSTRAAIAIPETDRSYASTGQSGRRAFTPVRVYISTYYSTCSVVDECNRADTYENGGLLPLKTFRLVVQ